jgi:hypothetical protein
MDDGGVGVNSSDSIGAVENNLCDKRGLSERVRGNPPMYIEGVRGMMLRIKQRS